MQPKTKTYDAHTTADNSNLDSLLPASICSNDNSRLTHQENELYKALCQVPTKTIWGKAISDCLQRVKATGNVKLFRELVKNLTSQYLDCPQVMKNILGVKAYTVLSLFS